MVEIGVRIESGTTTDVPTLERLWLTIHRHHVAVMPQLGPYVSDEQSWAVRRRLYEEILSAPGSVLMIAREHELAVGYALGKIMSRSDRAWLDDTWSVEGPVAEVESLAVLPAGRGRGIGRRLLESLVARLRLQGADSFVVGALPDNAAAISLYRTLGFAPTWLYLGRLHDR